MRKTILILAGAFLTATAAQAKPVPVPRGKSQCPSGYASGAAYCSPMTPNPPTAIPKIGNCPAGWMQSGSYCIKMRKRWRE